MRSFGKKRSVGIVEATMAELAFLFVFAMFVSLAVTSASSHIPADIGDRLEEEIARINATRQCECDLEVQRDESNGDVIIRTWCGSEDDGRGLFLSGDQNYAVLSDRGQTCFDMLCPVAVIEAWRSRNVLERITIQGHASTEWEAELPRYDGVRCVDEDHCNQIVSSRRSLTVFSHCLASMGQGDSGEPVFAFPPEYDDLTPGEWPGYGDLVQLYYRVFRNEGLGARAPILIERPAPGPRIVGLEDRIASRRVEIRFSRRSD